MPPGTLQASTFSWNVRLVRYVNTGQPAKTMELFQRMQQEGMVPDKFTFVPVLNACASLQALEEGRCVHLQIMERGFESIPYVGNSLIDMYAKCGNIEDAWKVFDKMSTHDVVSWNSIISGHVKCRQAKKALELFQQMQQEGLNADRVTFLAVLNACAIEMAVEEGRQVHNHIIRSGYESDVFVGSSLVDMYAKCGSIGDAQRVFHKMPMHNVVSWSAMIWGHVKCRQEQKALELYRQMQVECVKPEPVTFVGVLNACASAGWLEEGRRIHDHIIKRGYESDLFVGSSLVDMYAKCGSIKDAQHVFNKMSTCNAVTWNAMLAGYAIHGHAREAFEHFEQMCEEGVEIGLVTFVSLLSTCSHAGLVDEGLVYFDSMSLVHHVSPTVEHYACMVDLFGRAGHLHEAEELIKTMSCEPNAPVWKALLGACRVYGDVEMGERVAEQVLRLDPGNSAGYVMLANIYAAAGNWDSCANIQRLRLERVCRNTQGAHGLS